MEYQFKPIPETLWAVLVAVVVTMAQLLTAADSSQVLADPKAWLIVAAAAIARAVFGAVLGAATPDPPSPWAPPR